ncbi:type IV pilus modification PilV family protein [Marinobacterium mangrovicola]|uniref:General secretion pathway protein I n=1 Tax=Marinobacterium mangrovicola TaxID=1476959 RepID=A0A4R1GKA6_9GAMM|nr:general secretion pathway protein GspH [Marinobacterium mangrovicola]TCK08764.1 general secretion pathway protein I [Marinobacterium mangrovicola]
MNAKRDVRPEGGLTLLEVLVAFVLLASILGVVLNLNSLALDSTTRAADRQQALLLAQSQLDRVLARRELRLGRETGRFDDERYEWELRVRRFDFPDWDPSLESNTAEPYEIEISVFWDREKSLTVNTLRLVRPL